MQLTSEYALFLGTSYCEIIREVTERYVEKWLVVSWNPGKEVTEERRNLIKRKRRSYTG